jgi:phosphoribosyl-AMP cyclohydrolase
VSFLYLRTPNQASPNYSFDLLRTYLWRNVVIDIDFKKSGGLIPVIIQDAKTNEVLMLGYMNEEAWKKTLETGRASFWSRSRREIWVKGETSGHFQEVKEISLDCDGDTLLLKVNQIGGAACHTGFRSCFHHRWEAGEWTISGKKVFDPKEVYKK